MSILDGDSGYKGWNIDADETFPAILLCTNVYLNRIRQLYFTISSKWFNTAKLIFIRLDKY